MRAPRLVPRILVLALLGAATAGCASPPESARTPAPPAPRWIVLGDRAAGPDLTALLSEAEDAVTRPLPILDLSDDGAGIDAIVDRQVRRLGGRRAPRYILRFGPADAAGPAPLHPDAYGALIRALLTTLDGRDVVVGTIPASAVNPEPDEATAVAARRLRRVLEYNEQIRAAVRAHGALLVEQEYARLPAPEAMALSRSAWRAAVASGAPSAGSTDATAAVADRLTGVDGPTLASLRQRATEAIAAGGRADGIAKVGDSITATPAFLAPLTVAEVLGSAYSDLAVTLGYFSQAPARPAAGIDVSADLGGVHAPAGDEAVEVSRALGAAPAGSSLSRRSLAAADGWRVADVLAGGEDSPLLRELAQLRPVVALVMFGTNDLARDSVETFEAELERLLRALEDRKVLAVMSTIPARVDDAAFARQVPRFNAAVRALAALHQIPLIDYAAAMAQLPNLGLSADGIHPSTCPDGAGSLSAACLRYGSNLRNLLTLQALDVLHRSVLEPGER